MVWIHSEIVHYLNTVYLRAKVCSHGWLLGFWPAGSSLVGMSLLLATAYFSVQSPKSVEDDCRLSVCLDLGKDPPLGPPST